MSDIEMDGLGIVLFNDFVTSYCFIHLKIVPLTIFSGARVGETAATVSRHGW